MAVLRFYTEMRELFMYIFFYSLVLFIFKVEMKRARILQTEIYFSKDPI